MFTFINFNHQLTTIKIKFIMKLKQLILSILIIIGTSISLQAQFIDKMIRKTEQKIESEAENRTQRKIDKKIDEAFDETEEGLEGTTKKDKTDSSSNEVTEVESSYAFEVTATMLITSFDKKKETYTKMKQSYGTNALMSEVDVDKKMLFITDFNNDLAVNFADLGYMKSVFFTTDPDADLNGDGAVNFADLGLLKSMFFQSPGPSGLVP
jgi:hypothetical protein